MTFDLNSSCERFALLRPDLFVSHTVIKTSYPYSSALTLSLTVKMIFSYLTPNKNKSGINLKTRSVEFSQLYVELTLVLMFKTKKRGAAKTS